MNMHRHHPEHPASGFTLVETMYTVAIVGLLMAGLLTFYKDSTVSMYESEKKAMINRDMRAITEEMTKEARNANHFVMYESFSTDLRNVPPDALEDDDYFYDPNGWSSDYLSGTSPSDASVPDANVNGDFDPASYFRKRDGESGDFLLLITYGDDLSPYDTAAGTKYPDDVDYTKPITKLVGYFRVVEDETNQTGPVRKFIVYPRGSDQYKPLEDLIPSSTNADDYPVVIELSKGLANQRLFYNFRDTSIMVNGQIMHGTKVKRLTDTYNFTISPRG
ncbi:MAG: prepilin-type N-terminal cleavage/methylation domain-containing protein [Verrucomicrobiota bacterium JB024]|nr:prepilin-type N-terminal cleavage/methylation domain-containing protein [Verrucomicrobiota bacterium JB024]